MQYAWLGRALEFLETNRIEPAMVEAVVEHPTTTRIHPKSAQCGYPIRTYRRGDIEVCVGYQYPERPTISYVHLHLPMDGSKGGKNSSPVKKAAAKAPNGLKQFKQWVWDAGYTPVLRNGHVHVLRANGSLLMVTSSTTGDKQSITAAWQKFLRESVKDEDTDE